MDKVGLVLEQFVDAFYYISLAQHHLVPQGHKLVFHVRLEPMNEVDSLVEEVLKEFLLDVPLVGKHFTVEHLVSIPLSLCRLRLRELGRT